MSKPLMEQPEQNKKKNAPAEAYVWDCKAGQYVATSVSPFVWRDPRRKYADCDIFVLSVITPYKGDTPFGEVERNLKTDFAGCPIFEEMEFFSRGEACKRLFVDEEELVSVTPKADLVRDRIVLSVYMESQFTGFPDKSTLRHYEPEGLEASPIDAPDTEGMFDLPTWQE